MKKKKFLIFNLLFLSFIGGHLLFDDINAFYAGDTDQMELRSIIIEGWETSPWSVETKPSAPESIASIKLVTAKPNQLSLNSKNKKSLGVKFNFIYEGNNSVFIKPVNKKVVRQLSELDKNNKPKTIEIPGAELPGRVKFVSVWVLGRGKKYNLEGWIEDWKGDVHIYKFGSINFIGWKPMIIKIPKNVPQKAYSYSEGDSYSTDKSLIFKQFVLRSTPKTSSGEVVVFFDSLKVLTDMYSLNFDGSDVSFDQEDEKKKNRLKQYESQLKQQQD